MSRTRTIVRNIPVIIILIFIGTIIGYKSHYLLDAYEHNSIKELVVDGAYKTLIPRIQSKLFIEADPDFKKINKLQKEVYLLNNYWDRELGKWFIEIRDLRDNTVIKQWHYLEDDLDLDVSYNKDNIKNLSYSSARTLGSLLLGDYSLIVPISFSKNLMRIDKDSNIIWKSKSNLLTHHSINLDHQNNIWSCANDYYTTPEGKILMIDYLVKNDVVTGEVLFEKSLLSILEENELHYIIHGYNNFVKIDPKTNDIVNSLYLNDIEPVLKDGKFWKKGDLLLSLRNRSMILLYRPSSNKILKIIQGRFINQHDVDIFSETQIAIYNNNTSSIYRKGMLRHANNKNLNTRINKQSEIVIYDFDTESFFNIENLDKHFQKQKIYNNTQGLYRFLSKGRVFVEATTQGKIFIFNEKEVIYQGYCNQPHSKDQLIQLPNWSKIYEALP